jgi:hypothetical protein
MPPIPSSEPIKAFGPESPDFAAAAAKAGVAVAGVVRNGVEAKGLLDRVRAARLP